MMSVADDFTFFHGLEMNVRCVFLLEDVTCAVPPGVSGVGWGGVLVLV